jgi:uncharacterized protein YbjQ (UPF0145 family)
MLEIVPDMTLRRDGTVKNAPYNETRAVYALIGGLIMIITTTPGIDGRKISEYLGVVTGEAILGANIMKDIFAGFRDIVGGRSSAYEQELQKARQIAMREMEEEAASLGANAIVGVDIDYETVSSGNMLMVSVSGTAVRTSLP